MRQFSFFAIMIAVLGMTFISCDKEIIIEQEQPQKIYKVDTIVSNGFNFSEYPFSLINYSGFDDYLDNYNLDDEFDYEEEISDDNNCYCIKITTNQEKYEQWKAKQENKGRTVYETTIVVHLTIGSASVTWTFYIGVAI